jgi:hypothetical protein
MLTGEDVVVVLTKFPLPIVAICALENNVIEIKARVNSFFISMCNKIRLQNYTYRIIPATLLDKHLKAED